MAGAGKSTIEWTDTTWNPVTGCDKVSPGCKHCYAETMAWRLQAMGQKKYVDGFAVKLHPKTIDDPLTWRKPRMIFVNSMSDLFHEKVPIEFIQRVFDTMNLADRHTFQILTKRDERLLELDRENSFFWSDNIWMGVSVESAEWQWRIYSLGKTKAKLKFLSLEPLLGPLPSLILDGIGWVIVGGESGPGARPMNPDWVREIRDQCIAAGVPFFFKQWGGVNKKKAGRVLDSRTWDEMP